MAEDHSPAATCYICKQDREFTIPPPLLDSFGKGDVVIFAGAGVSTETKTVNPLTLYEDIARELGVDPSTGPSFADLMGRFCAQADGRQKLLIRIKERLNYISSFPELYRHATRFHRQLSTMYQIESIVTTNWDDYFEFECGATPFVTAHDFAVWKMPGRKVFKIHGSINNLGSIVATTEDYDRCYQDLSTGVIGSVLKTLLATKTIVYVGYSFSDSDFLKIHEILTSEMRGARPHSYVVTVDESARQRLASNDMTPIITSGSHFLAHIKKHLKGHIVPENQFDGLGSILDRVSKAHEQLSTLVCGEHPSMILSLSYQDGLMHALERIMTRKKAGEYSHACDVVGRIRNYDEVRRERLRRRKYDDVAYIDGYQNGLFLLLASSAERKHIPVYYIFGSKEQPSNWREYKRMLSRANAIHRSAFADCQRTVRDMGLTVPGMTYHHLPFLY